jgi:hypothetical protein
MTSLLALAALAVAAHAQSGVPSAAQLRQRAARAFGSGLPVGQAVSEAEFAWAKAAASRPETPAVERDSFAALSAALPLADKIQSGGAPADEVRHAAQLLGADETACLCLYAGGPCANGLQPVAGGGGKTRAPLKGLATGDQVSSWIAGGASTFETRDAQSLAGGVTQGTTATGRPGTAGTAGAGLNAPGRQLPAGFRTSASAPPPLVRRELSGSDKVVNSVLSVANLEAYSRAGTLNRESKEGSKRRICDFLAKAGYDPAQAWALSKAARDAKDADPGDLDLRNAEHYLYAYSTTDKPSGWGDSVPAQLLMALGWTPFKTLTKAVRPTSTPSWDELTWGVKGSLAGWSKPDWRRDCAASVAAR